jgi:hypothetical protein
MLNRRVRLHAVALAAILALGVLQAAAGSAAQVPRGFVPIVGAWTAAGDGSWSVDGATWSGKTSPDDARRSIAMLFGPPSDRFIANATAAGAFPLAVWRETSAFSNGTLRTQFTLIAGATDQTAGIVFGLNPAGEYFYLRYNTRDGNVAIWAFANGERRLIHHGEEKTQLALGAWHDLAVTIDGRRVSGVAGGKVHVDHTLDTIPAGRVGLWTKRDSVTSFRNFAVSAR